MFDKKELRKAFGYPFTTKKQVRDAMSFKDYSQVRQLFHGLGRYRNKFYTDDVINRLIAEVEYTD